MIFLTFHALYVVSSRRSLSQKCKLLRISLNLFLDMIAEHADNKRAACLRRPVVIDAAGLRADRVGHEESNNLDDIAGLGQRAATEAGVDLANSLNLNARI